jgi:hypothetical protein
MTTERKSFKMGWHESTDELDNLLSEGWEVEKMMSNHPSYSRGEAEGYLLLILIRNHFIPDPNIRIE